MKLRIACFVELLLIVCLSAWITLHDCTPQSMPSHIPIPEDAKPHAVAVSKRIPMPIEVTRYGSGNPVTGDFDGVYVEVKYPNNEKPERSFLNFEERLGDWLKSNSYENLPVENVDDATQLADDLIRLYECGGHVAQINVLGKTCRGKLMEKCLDVYEIHLKSEGSSGPMLWTFYIGRKFVKSCCLPLQYGFVYE